MRALVLLLLAAGLAPAADSPNILFLAIDDLNDWIGAMGGHPDAKTPHLDRLIRRGVLFTNAHTQAPVCGPSRASLMTGMLPSTTGIYGFLDDDEIREASPEAARAKFLFEAFREAGYHTMAVGKLFHQHVPTGSVDESGGREPGFGPKPEKNFVWDRQGTSTDWGAYPPTDAEMPDYRSAAWAVERLGREYEKPYLLAVGFLRPHVPWYVPPKWFDLHPAASLRLPPYQPGDQDDVPALARRIMALPMMPTAEWARESGEWPNIVQAYLASISFVDAQVGKVLDALDAREDAENTILVLWSDHGYHIGEKNRFAKHSLWEEATRVPLAIAAPGVEGGRKTSRPVGLIDLYPTLLDLAGLPPHPLNEGRSLQPLLDDPGAAWDRPVLTTYGFGNHALRTERFRYIRYEDGSEELYDHDADPNEWTNRAGDPAFEDVIERLRARLPEKNAPWSPLAPYDYNEYLEEAFERHKAPRP